MCIAIELESKAVVVARAPYRIKPAQQKLLGRRALLQQRSALATPPKSQVQCGTLLAAEGAQMTTPAAPV